MSKYSLRSNIRLAVLVGTSALLLAMFSSSAFARDYYYDCGTLDPNWWCQSPEIHTYGYNEAHEAFNRSMNMCSKLTKPYDDTYYYGRKCAWGSKVWVYSNGGGRAPYPNNSVSMRAWVANGANANSWWIMGYATY